MTYDNLLEELNAKREEAFANFQRRLIPTKQKIIGVRTPTLRILAKEYAKNIQTLFTFPDEFYEVTFIKLAAVSLLPYEEFTRYVKGCVALMDNWATCDCFKAKCIQSRRDDFLPTMQELFDTGQEFYQRYVLVTLLTFYIDKKYIPLIGDYVKRTDTSPYYAYMAVAWLVAEVLVKRYDDGVCLLKSGVLDAKTQNKSIQKATESFRLTKNQKEYLRSLKIKSNHNKG